MSLKLVMTPAPCNELIVQNGSVLQDDEATGCGRCCYKQWTQVYMVGCREQHVEGSYDPDLMEWVCKWVPIECSLRLEATDGAYNNEWVNPYVCSDSDKEFASECSDLEDACAFNDTPSGITDTCIAKLYGPRHCNRDVAGTELETESDLDDSLVPEDPSDGQGLPDPGEGDTGNRCSLCNPSTQWRVACLAGDATECADGSEGCSDVEEERYHADFCEQWPDDPAGEWVLDPADPPCGRRFYSPCWPCGQEPLDFVVPSCGDFCYDKDCCPPGTGACCDENDPEDCRITTEEECVGSYTWLGLDSDCSQCREDPSGSLLLSRSYTLIGEDTQLVF